MKKRVSLILGTRPEAIKMAPVYLTLKNDPRMDVSLIVTAQHRQMLDQVLEVFKIIPDYDLNIMRQNQTLSQVSARVIEGVQKTLAEHKPDAVLVHGDTTTCLFSALAAFYEKIPIGHVEAGLRTYNYNAPWPEEMNRRLVDPIARWCFAPTQSSVDNLIKENIPKENIFITGNTIVDALLRVQTIVRQNKPKIDGLSDNFMEGRKLILVTGHRRESFGGPFEELCYALRQIVEENKNVVLVYPVHLNPNVQKPVKKILGNIDRVFLIEPVGYLQFVHLMDLSYIIITDSGGIQEEAPSLHKPVLVMRETTERPEAVQSGLAKLVGTSREKIINETTLLLTNPEVYKKMSHGKNPYGDGTASKSIADVLYDTLK